MPLIVTGYHGASVAGAVGISASGWARSAGHDDWLGTGVYFFQDAPAHMSGYLTRSAADIVPGPGPSVVRTAINSRPLTVADDPPPSKDCVTEGSLGRAA